MRILHYACVALCALLLTASLPARAEAQAIPGPCTRPAILQALATNPAAAVELLTVAGMPFVPAVPATIAQSVIGVLWYNIHATTDARQKLGDNPFDNAHRVSTGSSENIALNEGVQRSTSSPHARAALPEHETSGLLDVPLVAIHTTGDEIVSVGHLALYGSKAQPAGRGVFVPIPVARYGHCNFTAAELLIAFGLLVALP